MRCVGYRQVWEYLDGAVAARGEPGLAAGSAVVLSARPEQLALFETEDDGRFPVDIVLSLPMAGNVVHEAAAADGTPIKVESRRAGATLHEPGARRYCGFTPGSFPNVFLKV